MMPFFFMDWQGRVLAWTLGPLLVLFSGFTVLTTWPWSIGEAVGWGVTIALCLFSAAVMLVPKRLPWGDLGISGAVFLCWLGHTGYVLFGPPRAAAPWWAPVVTFALVGGPAGFYFLGQYVRGNFIFIARTHPLFAKAKVRCKQTWPLFLSLYEQAPAHAWVKLRPASAGDGPYLVDGTWVLLERADERSARIRAAPDASAVEVALDEIQDWRVTLPDGTVRGAFSEQALKGAFKMQLARPPLWLRRTRFADPLS